MVGRVFKPLECWPNTERGQPVIPVTLTTLEGRRVLDGASVPIDTGFAGAMLLSREVFTHFEKAELPESEARVYRTLLGSVPMRTARAIIKLPRCNEVEVFVDSPRYGLGKSFLGAKAIANVELLLDGHASQTCLVQEASS